MTLFKRFITLIPLLFLAIVLKAQDNDAVTFEMRLSKDKLGINERLRVDFAMNKDGDNFNPPDFTGFRVLMGPSQSISSSWVNGCLLYTKTYSYTSVSYTHLRAHETDSYLVCRLLLEK